MAFNYGKEKTMIILEEIIVKKNIQCDCGNTIHEGSYNFHHEFPASSRIPNKLTVDFRCGICMNDFTYIGVDWNTLILSVKKIFAEKPDRRDIMQYVVLGKKE